MSLIKIELFVTIVILPLTQGVLQQAALIVIVALNILQILQLSKITFDKLIFIFGTLWVGWIAISSIRMGGGINRLIQMVAFLSMLIVSSNYSWPEKDRIFGMRLYLLFFVSWMIYFPFSPSLTGYSAYFASSNIVGTICFNAVAFFSLVTKDKSK